MSSTPAFNPADLDIFLSLQKSPLKFVELMFGLTAQKPGEEWIRGKHLSSQQVQFFTCVEKAIKKEARPFISVASGHGTGKTADMAMLILWFLFCFKDCQIPCTAPTGNQLFDVLWKELAKWILKMPEWVAKKFEWSSTHLRVLERPQTWFAVARAVSKENPEALAGFHADNMLYVFDEASGVPDEVFHTAEGALTGGFFLMVMISNYTRSYGYFHESHTKFADKWQRLYFNAEQSPLVNKEFVDNIVQKYGKDSDPYRIRVQGLPPQENPMDNEGYVSLVDEDWLTYLPGKKKWSGTKRLGVDPSGEGYDSTTLVVRDNLAAGIYAEERISNPKTVALRVLGSIIEEDIANDDVTIDNFGEGANVSQELALSKPARRVRAVNVKDAGDDTDRFLNMRAEAYWRMRSWLKQGGALFGTAEDWKELLNIRYRSDPQGRIQIMSKEKMRKQGIKSPNRADALMLTFVKPDMVRVNQKMPKVEVTYDGMGRPSIRSGTGRRSFIDRVEVVNTAVTK